jgi:hypothetical protein
MPPDYVTRIVFSRDGVHQGVGSSARTGEFKRARAAPTWKAACSSPTGNSRLQIFDSTGNSSPSGSSSTSERLYIDKNDKLYVIDADSSPATNPGWKKGIRIGSAKDGKVVAFIPGHQTDSPDGAAGEGIVSDPAGNLYAAENTLRGVTKYAKQ